MANEDLTAARARELLEYDPATGVLRRRVSLSRSTKVGDLAGSVNKYGGYVAVFVDGARYQAHRVAWLIVHGEWPACQIDHINGLRGDNRLCNLRVVTNRVNQQNKRRPRAGNTSGLLGVSWMTKANKWRAQIAIDGRVVYLGLFVDKHEAHAEYLKAKRQIHAGCSI